jgi:hypothetical protein
MAPPPIFFILTYNVVGRHRSVKRQHLNVGKVLKPVKEKQGYQTFKGQRHSASPVRQPGLLRQQQAKKMSNIIYIYIYIYI